MSDVRANGWLERAVPHLIAILDLYDAHQEALAAAREDAPLRLGERLFSKPIQPIWVSRVERAAEDGVGKSLRASIREAGWAAYAHGGLNAMHTLCDAIEGHPEGGSGYAAGLDKLWDSITGNSGTWVA